MAVNSKGMRVSKAAICMIIYLSLEMWPSQTIGILIININFHITNHKSNVSFYMNNVDYRNICKGTKDTAKFKMFLKWAYRNVNESMLIRQGTQI